MNKQIEWMVEQLFINCEQTGEVLAAREEITNNCQEHYLDLIRSGLTEAEALDAIRESLRGMEELANSYPQRKRGYTASAEEPKAGTAEEYHQTWTQTPPQTARLDYAAHEVKALELGIGNHDLTLEPSMDGMYHLSFENDKVMDTLSLRLDNGTLRISPLDRLKESVSSSFKDFTSSAGDPIRNPDDIPDLLRKLGSFMKNASKQIINSIGEGSFTVQVPVTAMPRCVVSGLSGDITLDRLAFRDLQLSTVSGDVTVHGTSVQGDAQIHTTSGDVEANLMTDHNIAVNTISGEIELSGSCSHQLMVNTTSGDIELVPSCPSCSVRTVSGDARIAVQDTRLRQLTLHTISGDVDIELPDALQADLHTTGNSSGEIRMEHESYGEGGRVDITISTASGDVTIS